MTRKFIPPIRAGPQMKRKYGTKRHYHMPEDPDLSPQARRLLRILQYQPSQIGRDWLAYTISEQAALLMLKRDQARDDGDMLSVQAAGQRLQGLLDLIPLLGLDTWLFDDWVKAHIAQLTKTVPDLTAGMRTVDIRRIGGGHHAPIDREGTDRTAWPGDTDESSGTTTDDDNTADRPEGHAVDAGRSSDGGGHQRKPPVAIRRWNDRTGV